MKRKRKKIKNKIIIFLFILIFLSLGYFMYSKYFKEVELDNKEKEEEVIIEEEKPIVNTLSMIMVGDALIHDRLYNDAYKNGVYDFKPYLKIIKEIVSKYDIAYYNQETILGGTSIGLSSYPSFNSPQELGDAFIDAGFNTVSLATNHTLDRGEKAVKLSREYWNKHDDVYSIGSYTSYEEKEEIESKVMEKNGIKYAILNYTYGTNGIPVPYGENYLVNLWNDETNYEGYKKQVELDINKLKDKVDVLMVAMHWGREYTHTPTYLETETAKYLSSLGVDIIIGTHPHVIQPVEYVGDTLVFYSLGNFLSAQNSESCYNYKCNIGLMSSLTITKTIDGGEISVTINNIENDLVYTYHNNYHNYLLIPFSNNLIKDYLNNYENVYKEYANIIATDDERIKTKKLGV